jgi:acetyl-CoA acyltransferase
VDRGDLKRAMAHASVKSHANAAKNPKAHLKNAITEDDAIKAPMVAEPLGLYDCCPTTDGAAAVVLASAERARALGREPLAVIRAYAYAAVDPADQLLIAPAYAIPIALRRAGLRLADIDLFEMHEAFAAQVLSTLEVLDANGVGRIPEDRLNVMGGSIALGHPFGATGARILLTLAHEMRRRRARYGLMSVCAAGGNGAAIVLERAA